MISKVLPNPNHSVIPFPFLMTHIYCTLERQQQVLYVTMLYARTEQLRCSYRGSVRVTLLEQLLWTLLQRAPCWKLVPKCSSHAAHSKPCYKGISVLEINMLGQSSRYFYISGLQLSIHFACLSQLRNVYCKIVLAKGKKKVRSWRTGVEGEDMALPIIQKKERASLKKPAQNTTKNRKKYLETTGKENDASFFQR